MLNSAFSAGRLNVGDTVVFVRRGTKEQVQAVVVDITRFEHCPGASEFKCYSDETKGVHGLDILGGNYQVVARVGSAEEGQAEVEKALASYKAHLSQYKVWAERFQAGGSVSF